MKKITLLLLVAALVFSLAACGTPAPEGSTVPEQTGEKIYKAADSWMYATLNPHVDYQGWQEFGYGGTEMLYHIEDDGSVVPWLAKSATVSDDGKTWTITLRDDVHFSDGDTLTAEMVIANLKDIGEMNSRYPYYKDATMEVVDEKTLTITLAEPYLTLTNDLADPDAAIIKMGDDQDIDNKPISTGAFCVKSFTPESEVVMTKNENYWNGEAQIDGAVISYVPDPDTQMMAMQNGEISALSSPTASALEIFSAEPDKYDIVKAATSRLYFYYLNCNTLSDNVRKAINLSINIDDYVTMMGGLLQKTVGPFLSTSAFGNATKPGYDVDAAKAAMEADGYTMNADGYYEKDGAVMTVNLCYYTARSLDKFAALMQEQLKAVGIKAEVKSFEDPDAGYVTNGNYDIGLYNAVVTPSGDPYYYLNLNMNGGAYNSGGFNNAEVREMLTQMAGEKDTAVRAELAEKIVQIAIDNNAFGYMGHLVKATVLSKGVSGIGETNPYHAGISADTRMD